MKHGVLPCRNGVTIIMQIRKYIYLALFAGILFSSGHIFAQKKMAGHSLVFY